MRKAIRLAAQGGLVRFKGGFWSYPTCPLEKRSYAGRDEQLPSDYVNIQTIDACVARGWMVRKGPRFDDPVALTEAGAEHVRA
jgi:hypothetical protein